MIKKEELEAALIQRLPNIQVAMMKAGLRQMMTYILPQRGAITGLDMHFYLEVAILAADKPTNSAIARLLATTRADIKSKLEEFQLHDLGQDYTVDRLLDEIEAACRPSQPSFTEHTKVGNKQALNANPA